jgi:hypothetical protein
MDLLISIGHGWYMPYCNFDSPLLIRFACVQFRSILSLIIFDCFIYKYKMMTRNRRKIMFGSARGGK